MPSSNPNEINKRNYKIVGLGQDAENERYLPLFFNNCNYLMIDVCFTMYPNKFVLRRVCNEWKNKKVL